MSSPISLYCGDIRDIIEKLRSYDDDADKDEEYKFPYEELLDEEPDVFLMDLGSFVEKKQRQLSPAEAVFLRSFVWDWINADPIIDMDVDRDEVGVNAVISNQTLKNMDLQTIDLQKLAAKLFAPSEAWETPAELAQYLGRWHKTYVAARDQGHGIVLKVWV